MAGYLSAIRRGLLSGVIQNTLTGSTTLTSTVTLCSINAVISGSSGLTKGGPGIVVFNTTPTYTGLTTINQGTLCYGVEPIGNAGLFPSANALTIAAGATFLSKGNSSSVTAITGTITATGGDFRYSGTGNALLNFASASTYNWPASGGTFGNFYLYCTGTGATTRGIQCSVVGKTIINVTAKNIYINGNVGGKSATALMYWLFDTSAVNGPQTHLCSFARASTNYGITTYVINAGTGTVTLGDCTATAGTMWAPGGVVQGMTINAGTINYASTNGNTSTVNAATIFFNASTTASITSTSIWNSTAASLTEIVLAGSGTTNITATQTAGNTGAMMVLTGGGTLNLSSTITGGAASSIQVGLASGSITATGGASGQNVITTASTTGVAIGQKISGTGIGVAAFVQSFVANTSVTISTTLTATASGTYTLTGGAGLFIGTGTVATTATTLSSGSNVQGGTANATPGTLTFASLTMAGGGINVGTNGTTTVSTIALTGTLDVSGGCVVNLLNTISAAGTYTLTTGATALTGTSANVSLGTNSSGRTFSSFQFSGNNLQIVLT